MNDLMRDLQAPLTVDNIDFRIQSINRAGVATILAYKDARVDMQRLDEVIGPMNWRREHCRDNHNCIVSIWDESKSQWVSKEDTGTESYSEAQKGLASDSFKRACFNWGIGRELYGFPLIQVWLKSQQDLNAKKPQQAEWFIDPSDNKVKQGWGLKLKEWRWTLKSDEGGNVEYLQAQSFINGQWIERFSFGKYSAPKASQEDINNRWNELMEKIKKAATIEDLKLHFEAMTDFCKANGVDVSQAVKAKDERKAELAEGVA